MSDVFTATGTKIYIGPSVLNTTDTPTEFAALTWTEITLVESIGEYGDSSSSVTAAVLGDGRMRKAKGSRDAGNMDLVVFPAPDDAGQQALIAAEATYSNFAFKIVLPNRLNATGTDQIDYFRALVMSKRLNVGGNDNIVRQTFSMGVNSAIATTPATAGA
jgi:hypothetical protein